MSSRLQFRVCFIYLTHPHMLTVRCAAATPPGESELEADTFFSFLESRLTKHQALFWNCYQYE